MAKVTLSYEVDYYEEKEVFKTLRNAEKNERVLDELNDWLRRRTKYGVDLIDLPLTEDTFKEYKDENERYLYIAEHIYEKCRNQLWELKREHED